MVAILQMALLLPLFILWTLASALLIAASQNKVSKNRVKLINSKVFYDNILPSFLFQQGKVEGGTQATIGGGKGSKTYPFIPDDTAPEFIFENAMIDMRSPILPYQLQDIWGCEREEEYFDVYDYENEYLKVTISPQFGGRILSVFDKNQNKELVYNSKFHQPSNIGTLHAWTAGGIEFNWSPGIIGHSVFSERSIYLSEVNTDRGLMLRVFDYDRYNSTTFQVDIMLNKDALLIHPKITNPTDKDVDGYWWTCVAIEADDKLRVLTPASNVLDSSRSYAYTYWPQFSIAIENASFVPLYSDNSYLAHHPSSGDYFLTMASDAYTPFIGHTDGDNNAFIHGHKLNGTKFFSWGTSGPSRFQQDFLASGQKGAGYYTELQVGVMPTQMQTFQIKSNSSLQWTEYFINIKSDSTLLNSPNYGDVIAEVEKHIKNQFSNEDYNDWDEFFSRYSSISGKIVQNGQPYGALEEMLRGKQLNAALEFVLPSSTDKDYELVQPFVELLKQGYFSEQTLAKTPLTYQTTDAWYDKISESASKYGMTWLHALHLGIILTERGEVSSPREMFTTSIALNPNNVIAIRNLAVLSSSTADAWSYYSQALSLLFTKPENSVLSNDDPSVYTRLSTNLVNEASIFLYSQSAASWYSVWAEFISLVPKEYHYLDNFIRLQCNYYNYVQEYQRTIDLLSKNCFPTFATDRQYLMTLWVSATEGLMNAQTALEKHRTHLAMPIPENIGCAKGSKWCLNYW